MPTASDSLSTGFSLVGQAEARLDAGKAGAQWDGILLLLYEVFRKKELLELHQGHCSCGVNLFYRFVTADISVKLSFWQHSGTCVLSEPVASTLGSLLGQ